MDATLPDNMGLDEAMHLDELRRREVHLVDDIGPISVRDVIRDINYSMALDPGSQDPITLVINSQGGGVHDAFGLYDSIRRTIKYAGIPIVGVVRGVAASGASMIVLQACSERKATENSRLHMHEPAGGDTGDKAGDVQEQARELTILADMAYRVVAARSEQEYDAVYKLVSGHEVWFSARGALEFGLIDEVML